MTGAPDEARARARAVVATQFCWLDGHADVWRLFETGVDLAAIVDGLAAPFVAARITHVVGVEARGFLLGGAVALRLGTGFVPIRKDDALFPGDPLVEATAPDYRGRTWRLRLRADQLGAGARAIVVDDWAERGSQALAARTLIERTGATFCGTSLVVDQLPDAVRERLAPVHRIVAAEELPAEHT